MNRRPDTSAPEAVQLDEALAAGARRRLREQGIVPVEPDDRIAVMLVGDERVVSMRPAVGIERRKEWREADQALRVDLYVTTRRVVGLGQLPIEVPLCQITDAVVAAGTLRLVVGDGLGVEIRTADPSVLRVEIAAVRAAYRAAQSDGGAAAVEGEGVVDAGAVRFRPTPI